mmetsp:Transcript_13285/g.27127  ORF Transcript_13285/g.27127 Transcript_13285/m.27127 type:complete len:214 (-) Transcript_13285:1693-2334(-)
MTLLTEILSSTSPTSFSINFIFPLVLMASSLTMSKLLLVVAVRLSMLISFSSALFLSTPTFSSVVSHLLVTASSIALTCSVVSALALSTLCLTSSISPSTLSSTTVTLSTISFSFCTLVVCSCSSKSRISAMSLWKLELTFSCSFCLAATASSTTMIFPSITDVMLTSNVFTLLTRASTAILDSLLTDSRLVMQSVTMSLTLPSKLEKLLCLD